MKKENTMGLLRKMLETAGENIVKDKEQRLMEKEFIRTNDGSKVISIFIADLFEKGNSAYVWVKKNQVGLFPVVSEDSVSLCYMKAGDGQSFSGMRPKDIEVIKYKFEEIYKISGLEVGYNKLNTITEINELESMINEEIKKLPHIKYNNGYLVKMFQ